MSNKERETGFAQFLQSFMIPQIRNYIKTKHNIELDEECLLDYLNLPYVITSSVTDKKRTRAKKEFSENAPKCTRGKGSGKNKIPCGKPCDDGQTMCSACIKLEENKKKRQTKTSEVPALSSGSLPSYSGGPKPIEQLQLDSDGNLLLENKYVVDKQDKCIVSKKVDGKTVDLEKEDIDYLSSKPEYCALTIKQVNFSVSITPPMVNAVIPGLPSLTLPKLKN